MRKQEGTAEGVALDAQGNAQVNVTLDSMAVTWFVQEQPPVAVKRPTAPAANARDTRLFEVNGKRAR